MSGESEDRARPRRRGVFGVTFSDVLRLLIASALVGVLLRTFDVNPLDLWRGAFDAAVGGWGGASHAVEGGLAWAKDVLLVGAMVVAPIWLAFKLLAAAVGRR